MPTTGTVIVVTSAIASRKHSCMATLEIPRASPTSASTEESINGRYRSSTTATAAAASAAVGTTSLLEIPNTSPNSSE